MRRLFSSTACTAVMLLAVACDSDQVHAPVPEATIMASTPANYSTTLCPDGYSCDPSLVINEPLSFDMTAIGANCGQEACDDPMAAIALWHDETPPNGSWFDVIRFECTNNSSIVDLNSAGAITVVSGASTAPGGKCFDCTTEGCAASCPAGAKCGTLPGHEGSDCRKFSCPAGWEAFLTGDYAHVATCGQPEPEPEVPGAPSTSASTVHGDTPSLTWSAVSGATSYNVYSQTNIGSWELTFNTGGTTYVGGGTEVSGSPQGGAPSGPWIRYRVTAVNAAGEGAPGATYYWTWVGGGGPSD